MSSRDPRIDPEPGDEIGMNGDASQVRMVVSVGPNQVVGYTSRCGNQFLNSTSRETMAEWRATTHNAIVLKVAGL